MRLWVWSRASWESTCRHIVVGAPVAIDCLITCNHSDHSLGSVVLTCMLACSCLYVGHLLPVQKKKQKKIGLATAGKVDSVLTFHACWRVPCKVYAGGSVRRNQTVLGAHGDAGSYHRTRSYRHCDCCCVGQEAWRWKQWFQRWGGSTVKTVKRSTSRICGLIRHCLYQYNLIRERFFF